MHFAWPLNYKYFNGYSDMSSLVICGTFKLKSKLCKDCEKERNNLHIRVYKAMNLAFFF